MDSRVFWDLSYGVYITTVMDGERPTGCVTNSAMQITSEPATIAVSVNHDNYTNSCIEKSGKFAVCICSEATKPLTIGTFGFRSGRDFNKFDDIPYEMKAGLPIVRDSINGYVVCEVINKLETDTHTVFLGRVMESERFDIGSKPMTYAYYHEVVKGRAPKNAPTYIDPEKLGEK